MKTNGPKKGGTAGKPAPANVSWESRKFRGMIEEGARAHEEKMRRAQEIREGALPTRAEIAESLTSDLPRANRLAMLDPSPASETRPEFMSEEDAKKFGLRQFKGMVLDMSEDSRAFIEKRLGKKVEDASPQELKNVFEEL